MTDTHEPWEWMTTCRATRDSIGHWDGLEQEAMDCWNHWVAPALASYYTRTETETGEEGAMSAHVAQHAWERFCDTDQDASFDARGQRVASWINAQTHGDDTRGYHDI
jgi:hypothetical protein